MINLFMKLFFGKFKLVSLYKNIYDYKNINYFLIKTHGYYILKKTWRGSDYVRTNYWPVLKIFKKDYLKLKKNWYLYI
jgi:hypothetical protein